MITYSHSLPKFPFSLKKLKHESKINNLIIFHSEREIFKAGYNFTLLVLFQKYFPNYPGAIYTTHNEPVK
jgi:hypothetical protein